MNPMTVPDLIFVNGIVRTQDNDYPKAQAVAVTGNRISAVGTTGDIRAMAGKETRTVDLQGKLVLPGFTDSHFHYFEWALNHDSVDLGGAASMAEMEERIRLKAGKAGPGTWLLGQGFDQCGWPENRLPTRQDLDRAAPDNPVCIWRFDLHMAVANSMALERAGITATTSDPAEGVIERDREGRPTGVLRELASNLIKDILPEPRETDIMDAMVDNFKRLHALGITGIHDVRLMGGLDGAQSLRAWQKLRETGRMAIRCHVALPGERTAEAVAMGLRTGFGDDMLRIGHLKFFADGGMGSRTAWMNEPYLDGGSGMPLTPVADIEAALRTADPAGLSIMVHAIGNRANRELVAMFERLEKEGAPGTRIPHRIEHVQMIEESVLDRMGNLTNVAASCQPNNLSLDITMIEGCAGPQASQAYNLRGMINRQIPLLLSSDAPVCDMRPLAGIFSAVTRTRMDHTPEKGWYMDQALSVDEAVKGYTRTPAEVMGLGAVLGTITPGKLADLAILERDIFENAPEAILETGIAMTVFDGRVVYAGEGC